jgi:UDP-N-acetylmuramyl pentapeptide synthase
MVEDNDIRSARSELREQLLAVSSVANYLVAMLLAKRLGQRLAQNQVVVDQEQLNWMTLAAHVLLHNELL